MVKIPNDREHGRRGFVSASSVTSTTKRREQALASNSQAVSFKFSPPATSCDGQGSPPEHRDRQEPALRRFLSSPKSKINREVSDIGKSALQMSVLWLLLVIKCFQHTLQMIRLAGMLEHQDKEVYPREWQKRERTRENGAKLGAEGKGREGAHDKGEKRLEEAEAEG